MLGVYEVKLFPEAIDLIVGSLQVTESIKNNIADSNKTIPRALTVLMNLSQQNHLNHLN